MRIHFLISKWFIHESYELNNTSTICALRSNKTPSVFLLKQSRLLRYLLLKLLHLLPFETVIAHVLIASVLVTILLSVSFYTGFPTGISNKSSNDRLLEVPPVLLIEDAVVVIPTLSEEDVDDQTLLLLLLHPPYLQIRLQH